MNGMFGTERRKLLISLEDEADEQLELLESVGLHPYPSELEEFLSSE